MIDAATILGTERWCYVCRRYRSALRFYGRVEYARTKGKPCMDCARELARIRYVTMRKPGPTWSPAA